MRRRSGGCPCPRRPTNDVKSQIPSRIETRQIDNPREKEEWCASTRAAGFRLGVDIAAPSPTSCSSATTAPCTPRRCCRRLDDYPGSGRRAVDLLADHGHRSARCPLTSAARRRSRSTPSSRDSGRNGPRDDGWAFATCSRCAALRSRCSTTSSTRLPPPLFPRMRRHEVREPLGPRGETWSSSTRRACGRPPGRFASRTCGGGDRAPPLVTPTTGPSAASRRSSAKRVGADVYVTRSSEILPEIREYERTSTTVVTGTSAPRSRATWARSCGGSARPGSSGGSTSCSRAAARWRREPERRPAHLIESGPAAGLQACSYLVRLTGRRHLNLARHGRHHGAGASQNGLPVRTTEYEVGAGSTSPASSSGVGHPIKLPFSRVRSRAPAAEASSSIDSLGTVSGGPRSAGSVPWPRVLRQRRNGADPHGCAPRARLPRRRAARLRPITVDPERARVALDRGVATPLGRSSRSRVRVLQLAVATMTRA